MAGVVAARRGAFEAAVTSFSEAIRLAPGDRAAYENLGRLYQERSASDPGASAKAIDVYQRLLHVDPSNAEALYQSAFLLALAYRSWLLTRDDEVEDDLEDRLVAGGGFRDTEVSDAEESSAPAAQETTQ